MTFQENSQIADITPWDIFMGYFPINLMIRGKTVDQKLHESD